MYGSRIYKSCTDQFKTNPVLATCTTHSTMNMARADAGVPLGVYVLDSVERYYNLDTITHDDVYMKNCIDMKGDWTAAEKNSPEYREAARARARREIEKAQKALGQ